MNKNIRFLSSALVLCFFGVAETHAAPSVKMLGANTARIGANTTVVKSDANANAPTQRLGSIRSKTVNGGAPVTVNKVVSPSATKDSGSDARLSLGKYIHSTGVSAGTIKPVANTASGAEVSSSDFIALSDQVRDLKNTKQDTISVGDGLVLSENTISLDPAVLQTQVAADVATALGDDYYTADQIDEMLDESGITAPTYASTTPGVPNYESIDVADSFDDDFNFTE